MTENQIKKAERRKERESIFVEEKYGFYRILEDATCPDCLRTCPVGIYAMKEAEGEYIEYVPPRIVEYSSCYYCEKLGFYEVVHQEGNAIPINRGY